jgi:hypothetical protein
MILFRCSSTKDIVATIVGEDGRMLSDDDYDDVVGGGLCFGETVLEITVTGCKELFVATSAFLLNICIN